NSFANFACLRACLSAVQAAQAGNVQAGTNFTIKELTFDGLCELYKSGQWNQKYSGNEHGIIEIVEQYR
ncbi:MAG: hypothetical protein J7J07_03125, partial [Syntrophobacterales bacterium]|nr:hypothetical protein [Syntrophobacterales bacterium]